MKKILSIALAAALAACGTNTLSAQKLKGGVFNLAGYTLHDAGLIDRAVSEGFQGLAIHKNYMIGLYNAGYASLYKISADGTFAKQATFPLGSQTKYNHANVANFGVEYYQKGDAMPLLYVSQTRKDPDKNIINACFVERILPEGKAELVQTILLGDHDKYYGNAVQWAIDKKRKRLIGFGNTIHNTDPNNNFRIMVFKLPKLKDGKTITLKQEDILENYLIQDYDKSFPHVQIGQGGVIAGNCIIMPVGLGTKDQQSVIYSWDLKHHKLINAINMQNQVPFEFEDCDFFNDKLYIQCNHGKQGHFLIMDWEK